MSINRMGLGVPHSIDRPWKSKKWRPEISTFPKWKGSVRAGGSPDAYTRQLHNFVTLFGARENDCCAVLRKIHRSAQRVDWGGAAVAFTNRSPSLPPPVFCRPQEGRRMRGCRAARHMKNTQSTARAGNGTFEFAEMEVTEFGLRGPQTKLAARSHLFFFFPASQ